jgi:L-lactate dehydrogenase complex protein LldF
VCPVKINIPEILIHLRKRVVGNGQAPLGERLAMKGAALAFSGDTTLTLAQAAGRLMQRPFKSGELLRNLPGLLAGWTATRDLPAMPAESFRQWWSRR